MTNITDFGQSHDLPFLHQSKRMSTIGNKAIKFLGICLICAAIVYGLAKLIEAINY